MTIHPWRTVKESNNKRNEKMLEMYKEGYSIRGIAREVGSTYGKVYYQIEKAGIPFRKCGRPINVEADNEVVSIYSETKSISKTAQLTGCSYGTVRNTLKRRGLL